MEIPEDEQWRLIDQSGILKQAQAENNDSDNDDDEGSSLPDEIFNAVLYIIPFSFLLLMMEILIHHQYGKEPTFSILADRMISGVPIMSIFIFYTTRYKQHRRMQLLLLILGSLSGSRMMYLLARAGFLKVMQQCPPLATLWIYTVVQLDLGPALLNLIVVGVYVWGKGLKVLR